MLAGADIAPEGAADDADPDWSRVIAGAWLSETLSMATISGSDQIASGSWAIARTRSRPAWVDSVFRGVVSRYTE